MEDFKAVLFDFDGVLAETMEDLFISWREAFLKFGIEIKKEDYFPLEGTKVIDVARIISKKYNISPDPSSIVRIKEESYKNNHKFNFYPGVLDLIELLKNKNIKIAIVSASTRYQFENTVPKYFLDKFNCVITGNDYVHGKPSPEPYLKAIDKLGLKSEDCIVVENAPFGIKSAKNAGCFCIAIASTLTKDFLKEADLIVDKFEDLNHILTDDSVIKRFKPS